MEPAEPDDSGDHAVYREGGSVEGAGRDIEPETGKSQPKASSDANGKSAKKTAAIVGVSQAIVERVRPVLSDPEVAQEVKAGKMSINKGAQIVKAKKKPPTPTRNLSPASQISARESSCKPGRK